jgi:uncharacterized membrane protein YedE/YeeE
MQIIHNDLTGSGVNLLAVLFGMISFMVGACFLFLISLGHWRVRRWPNFSSERSLRLEPTSIRVGRVRYLCADAALWVGAALLLGAFLFGLWIFTR